MISFLQPLPIGNAVKVVFAPPAGALTRILRKLTDDFTGPADDTALVVFEGEGDIKVDTNTLVNGTPYYYKPYYTFDETTWTTAPSATATPSATAGVDEVDGLEVLRQRLAAGLKVESDAGRLPLNSKGGQITVVTSPPRLDNIVLPVVSVHLRSDRSQGRGIGETIGADTYSGIGDNWGESQGWLGRVDLDIVGWTDNGKVRAQLRKAIKKIVVGNFSVFEDAGMSQIDATFSDVEDFDSYNMLMFQAMASFSYTAPFAVTSSAGVVDDVIVTANVV